VNRQGCRANATASADYGNDFPKLPADWVSLARERRSNKRLCQELRGHWLDDIFADSRFHQIPIKGNVVSVANRDHDNAGLTEIGKVVDLRGRHFSAADIDDDALGRSFGAKVSDRAGEASALDHRGRNRKLRETRGQ